MRIKAILILLTIIAATIPAYYLLKYAERKIKPRESLGGLILYLVSGACIIFVFVMAIVELLAWLVIPALAKHFGAPSI